MGGRDDAAVTAPWGTAVGTAIDAPPVPWTLGEFADWARPAIGKQSLMRIIAELPGFHSIGSRPPGPQGGRPAPEYDQGDLVELHNALRRWL